MDYENTYSDRAVTSRDIARSANVSQATVSRVLSGNPKVAAPIRKRVLAAIEQMNYRPNGMARAMRTNRTGNIGVIVSRLGNPIYPEILQILGQQLSERGLRMMVWNTDERDESVAATAVRESLVDGLLMTTATESSETLYRAATLNLPIVLVHRVVEGWPCDQVTSDNHAGGALAADYFVRSSRRRIAIIEGEPIASTIRDRQAGFRERLKHLGRPLDPACSVRAQTFSYRSGFEAASHLLEMADGPDTIFCVNDVLALGARDAARARSVAVPDDLWLIGYDDIEMASWTAFDLTTVRQPLVHMIFEAVTRLLARIDGQPGSNEILRLPNELVIRGSTGGHRPAC